MITEKALTHPQAQVLGYVADNGPVSVRDTAESMMMTESSARSRLDTLARRGLVDAQYTGHHRGSGAAYVATDRGAALAEQVFGEDDDEASDDEDEASDEPIHVTIVAYRDHFNRVPSHDLLPTRYRLSYDDLNPTEQAAVEAARAAGGSAVVGSVTVVPGKNLGVVEEWWT